MRCHRIASSPALDAVGIAISEHRVIAVQTVQLFAPIQAGKRRVEIRTNRRLDLKEQAAGRPAQYAVSGSLPAREHAVAQAGDDSIWRVVALKK
jgi:hypothetical protein